MGKFINAENLQYALDMFQVNIMKELKFIASFEEASTSDIENLFK